MQEIENMRKKCHKNNIGIAFIFFSSVEKKKNFLKDFPEKKENLRQTDPYFYY